MGQAHGRHRTCLPAGGTGLATRWDRARNRVGPGRGSGRYPFPPMTRVLSCIQPHRRGPPSGNYLGALVNWVRGQHECDAFHGIVDLHSLTLITQPGLIGDQTLKLAAVLFAIGLDPDVATVFVQSHVDEHVKLSWLMECTVSYGELSRMTQFKDKAAKREAEFVSAGLFTYPALQAADILLYDTDEVPVGEDQRQHIEITRDIAERFNGRFGPTFRLPKATIPAAGARVMDLQDPTSKMSKSATSDAGLVYLMDEPAAIMKKFKRAVTDSDSEVRYDRAAKPGVSNLLEILAVATGRTPEQAAEGYTQYGPLKTDAGEAVVAMLAPGPGALPRAGRRPRRAVATAGQGRRQGEGRRRGDVRARRPQHRPAPGLTPEAAVGSLGRGMPRPHRPHP